MIDMKHLRQGECVPAHVNDEADEVFVVLEGEVAFQCGDKSVVAGTGSMIFAPKGVLRSWKTVGNGDARTLGCAYGWRLDLPLFAA